MKIINISVRELVEYVLRSGSIDSTFKSTSSMQEGIKAHKKIQGSQGENYTKEVTLKEEIQYRDFIFKIEGRCDGVIQELHGTTIDEIKSTARNLDDITEDYNPLHWAQGKIYGYMYGVQKDLSSIDIQLTYVNIENYEEKRFLKTFAIENLREFLYELLDKYLELAELKVAIEERRDYSIKALEFPFKNYRKGQREMAVKVYRTVIHGKRLFVKAPTGIGKTVSTIFPSVKAIGEGLAEKIIYLTAKTITRTVAEDTFKMMKEKGLYMKVLTLTAKEKVCFNEEVNCTKEGCRFADGYYDRANEGIVDILKNEEIIGREAIENYARKYNLCPFEFSLDVSLFVDAIICDYNYVFDPRVSLKRYGDEDYKNYIVLVDEAHNLVDRAREMFSSSIEKRKIMDIKKLFKEKDRKIYKIAGEINKIFIDIRNDEESVYSTYEEKPNDLIMKLSSFTTSAERWLAENPKKMGYKELLDIYFEFNSFIRISKLYDERFTTFVERSRNDVAIKLFCLDPSKLLKEITKENKATIFFSGTLSPLPYFLEVLGGEESDYKMILKSPYNRENLSIYIYPISTRYRHREMTYKDISKMIASTIKEYPGNYLVFFPSYSYMNYVYENFISSNEDLKTIIQDKNMTEEEREDFLNNFSKDSEEDIIGFGVMGGIFSEGIDLKGDRLKGVIVVGVGLPQICPERDIIKDYYNEEGKKGYDYSYIYPGMNKVMQAAGRVIRTEDDKGTLVLIDDRFLSHKYLEMMPYEWQHFKLIK